MVTYSKMWVVPVHQGRVALYEVDPVHPGGEILITWDALTEDEPNPREVVMTPGVLGALARNMLRQVVPPKMEATAEDPAQAALDSLLKIKGIGVLRAQELYTAGVLGAKFLAQMDAEAITALARSVDTFSLTQLQEWQRKARLQVNG